jgi:hypothetical protein
MQGQGVIFAAASAAFFFTLQLSLIMQQCSAAMVFNTNQE